MSDLTDRVSYLRGLAEGAKLDVTTSEGMLISKMLEVLDELAKDNDELHSQVDELSEYVDSIDDDLSEIEEDIYGEDEDEDDEEPDFDAEDEDDDRTVEYTCPYCGETMCFDVDRFDFDEDYLCPNCHKPLFPEEDEDGDDEE
ncbi:MAG: hypothetical protein IJ240_11640 [Clostridia bacterium]|nr:hypothetical protein [Clostridia bacterium]